MACVRFICGTQTRTPRSRRDLSAFLGTDDTILYSSCFDANGGVFETLFGAEDAIISDELNHASIIDGIRLSKAARFRYKNADMADLEAQLVAARAGAPGARCIVTDGVFSMDGSYAPLDEICDLADEYDALVLVDDSHAVGLRRRRAAAARPSSSGSPTASTSSPARSARRWAAPPAATSRAHQEIVDLLRQRVAALPVLQRGRARGRRRLAGGAARSRGESSRGARDACAATPRCSAR